MGNSLGMRGKKITKVMKIDGETFKLKTPVQACDILKNHPGLVLLESESVKHYGVRAKPLEANEELLPKRLYFLVELPKETVPRRVRSGINMSAKDRLQSLVLSRRSASDLTIMKGQRTDEEEKKENAVRVKMRLPKVEVEKLIRGSKDEAEAGERILGLYSEKKNVVEEKQMMKKQGRISGRGGTGEFTKAREKRVSFMPISEGCSQIPVAS